MLKVNGSKIKEGIRIVLPEEWHDKILIFSKKETYPYEFILEEIEKDKETKETYYICKSEKKSGGKSIKIALTECTIKYLLSQEVPDLNIGLSFKEYLPLEDSQILITNSRNPSEVVPGIFKVEAELIRKGMICLNFKIYYTNGDAFTSIKYFCDGSKKSTWKLLFNEDTSYMTDYEKMFRDTIIHKSYVVNSCEKLARYLEKEGAFEHAKMLRENGKIHDDSKISCEDELHALSRIINDQSTMHDATKQLSPIQKDAIKLHYKHNLHHPEHYTSPIDMPKIYVMEMCCDWHARSTQKGTDFLEYVKTAQEKRFHFPDWIFAEIWHYCKVLDSEI